AVPLERSLGPLAGRACLALHLGQGVKFHLGETVERLVDKGGGRLVATLSGGHEVDADAVVVGVGAAPNVGWLGSSGLEVALGGVACDERLLAAPGVAVAGDIAAFPFRAGSGEITRVRVEHRTMAAEQGEHAAAALLGRRDPFEPVPYVWSDQYDVKIQVLGLPGPSDQVVVVDGSLESRRFVACLGRHGVFAAAVSFGRPRPLMKLRPLLARGASFAEALALDLS
ncbi:MAG: oxidoreductase C-terminal domain-containing protein, partial [Acidimicrobiales bacterium]